MPDTIEIRGIEVQARIGVPEEERQSPQRLRISILLTPRNGFLDLDDDIRRTIDYAAVTEEVRAVVTARPRHLIETLANEIAAALLQKHPLLSVEVLIEKFILPEVDSVAVRIQRTNVPPIAFDI